MPDMVVSIGYQGRSLESLCDALVSAGGKRLLDVRDRAWSQRPEFRKGVLSRALNARGIEYVHFKIAGNPTRPRTGSDMSVEACAAAFRAHLHQHPGVLPALSAELGDAPIVLFCFERDRDACHRGILIEELLRLHPDLIVKDA